MNSEEKERLVLAILKQTNEYGKDYKVTLDLSERKVLGSLNHAVTDTITIEAYAISSAELAPEKEEENEQ